MSADISEAVADSAPGMPSLRGRAARGGERNSNGAPSRPGSNDRGCRPSRMQECRHWPPLHPGRLRFPCLRFNHGDRRQNADGGEDFCCGLQEFPRATSRCASRASRAPPLPPPRPRADNVARRKAEIGKRREMTADARGRRRRGCLRLRRRLRHCAAPPPAP